MNDEIFLQEKRKYEKVWGNEQYRVTSPGNSSVADFLSFIKSRKLPSDSLIDFGCGTAIAAIPFLEAGFKVSLVDIAENCLNDNIRALTFLSPELITFFLAPLWELPSSLEKSDWIYCIDVLEHLPPERVDKSLREMAKKTKKGGALQVFLLDEEMGRKIGEKLHLTIRPLDWWLEKISCYWHIEEVYSIIAGIRYCIYVGAPKEEAVAEK